MKRMMLILLSLIFALTACGKASDGGDTGGGADSGSQVRELSETESSEITEPFQLDREYITNTLLDCMNRKDIQSAMARYEAENGMVSDFAITEAWEVLVDDIGSESNQLHLLMVRIGCGIMLDDGFVDGSFVACFDYDNGDFYDTVTLRAMSQEEKDAAPTEKARIIQEAVEWGYFKNANYAGEMLFKESEIRNQYPESDMAEINRVLHQAREEQIVQQQAEALAQSQEDMQIDLEMITQLVKDYQQSEGYQAAAARYKEITADEPEFAVDGIMALRAENMGSLGITLSFYMIHIDGGFAMENSDLDERFALVYDRDTGVLYDTITVDDDMPGLGEKEEFIYVAVKGGCFPVEGCTGNPIFIDGEMQVLLSQEELDEVNQAISEGMGDQL